MPTRSEPVRFTFRDTIRVARSAARWSVATLLCLVALAGNPAQGQERVALELAEVPLFTTSIDTVASTTAAKDYFIRLPEHVVVRDGSELHLALHLPDGATPPLCALSIVLNGRLVARTNLHGSRAGAGEDGVVLLRTPVPGNAFVAGWNKVSLQFELHPVKSAEMPRLRRASWGLRRAECFLSLAFERQPAFPELARFPHSLTEEKLLRPDVDSPFADAITPVLSILVPGLPRDGHLRATAIVAARLGQLGYLDERHCRLQPIELWKSETDQRNAIVIGRRDQLGGIDLPANIAGALTSLDAGQGLLAEFLHGPAANPRRLLLISGADDAGLEKAALTIGSAPALSEASPSPAVIDQAPEIPAAREAETQPGPQRLPLSDAAPIRFRGVFQSEQSVSDWRLPPGFQLAPGGWLRLQFVHSPGLLTEDSAVEALINGTSIGTIALGSSNTTTGSATLPLPSGLRGRDPMILTFRTMLAAPESDCARATNDPPWLEIAAGSTLESIAEPVRIEGLSQLRHFLPGDRFARRAAYAVPAGPTLDQVRTLFSLWFDLGRSLPSSPVLWPEVVTFQPGIPLTSPRLRGRSVLLLGPVTHWAGTLPAKSLPPALTMTSPDASTVTIQGHDHKISDFEPTLAFVQMLPSPWSEGEMLVLAGGWKDYAIPATKRLLLDASSTGQLHGQLGAIDVLGRSAAYDLWTMSRDSFAERVQAQIPPGLTPEESLRKLAAHAAQTTSTHRWNRITFYGFGILLVILVLARLWLMGEQANLRRKALAAEKSAGGAP